MLCAALLTVATAATGQADTQRVQELGVTLEVPRTPEPERFPTALVWQRWGDGYVRLAVHDGTPPASNEALRRVVTRAVSRAELVTQGRTDHGARYGVYVANATVGGVSGGGSHMRMVADVGLVGVSVRTGANRFVTCTAYVPHVTRNRVLEDARVVESLRICQSMRREVITR